MIGASDDEGAKEQKAKKKADRIRQVEEHKLVLQGKDAESVRQREMRAQKVRDENRKILLKKLRFRVIENGTVKALLDIIDTGERRFWCAGKNI